MTNSEKLLSSFSEDFFYKELISEKLLSVVFEKQIVHTLLQIITYWIDDDEYRIDSVLWQDNRSI